MFAKVQRIVLVVLLAAAAALRCAAAPCIVPLFSQEGKDRYCVEVLERIQDAREQILIMLSSASLEGHPLFDALLAAQARGVSVRVLLDASDWAPSITAKHQAVLAELLEGGIDARLDDPGVTTHAKLLVIDRAIVILGSTNWNAHALREHRQADVVLEDALIAGFYATYFDTVWERGYADVDIALPTLPSSGHAAVVPAADWPESRCYGSLVLDLLDAAEHSIHVTMYRMSYYSEYSDSLANQLIRALVSAAARGLSVQVLLDDCAYYEDSAEANLYAALFLHNRGVQVRFDGASETTHTKLVVIDGCTAVLGSTNWNYYALEQNVEANIALIGIPALGAQFEAFFQELWDAGRGVTD